MTYAESVSAEEIRRELGAILHGHRERTARSLTDIAREAGCSPGYLSEVERGLKDISTPMLVALCHALDAPVSDVYAALAGRVGPPVHDEPAWPSDPRQHLRVATAGLDAQSLRTVAEFSTFLASSRLEPRRRIGFAPPTAERR